MHPHHTEYCSVSFPSRTSFTYKILMIRQRNKYKTYQNERALCNIHMLKCEANNKMLKETASNNIKIAKINC